MCAVPVSKTAGRLSSFPRWRMRGQRGSCESYRLGSVKALPVGEASAAACLPGWRPFWACPHCSENGDIYATLLYFQSLSVQSTCHMFSYHNHSLFCRNLYLFLELTLTLPLCSSIHLCLSLSHPLPFFLLSLSHKTQLPQSGQPGQAGWWESDSRWSN